MKNFLITLLVGSVICLFFPMGWWILAFVWAFIIAVGELIWSGITALIAAAIAGCAWAIITCIVIILIIIVLIIR